MPSNRVDNALQSFLHPITRKHYRRLTLYFIIILFVLFSGSTSYGAWINVKSDLELNFERFSAAKYQGKYEKPRPNSPIRGGWY